MVRTKKYFPNPCWHVEPDGPYEPDEPTRN